MSNLATERRALSLEETADLLGVSKWLIYKQAQTHNAVCGVPVLRIGRRVLVPRDALERVLSGKETCDASS
jgi:proline dehydrogenase